MHGKRPLIKRPERNCIGLQPLYTAPAPIWGLPYESEIPMTITAVDALLGALLGVSSVKYQGKNDGAVD